MTSAELTRRKFLELGGSALLATVVAPEGMPSAARHLRQNPGEQVNLGIIGCGGRGRMLMRYFMEQGAVFSAVCDPDPIRMRQAKHAAGDKAEMIQDFRRLLERKEIDAVIVATPDHWHAIPTVYACQAGKDVYVEKPLAYSVAEGQAIVEAARRFDRVVQIGTQQRAGEHYHRAVSIIQGGDLGKVVRVSAWHLYNNALPGVGALTDDAGYGWGRGLPASGLGGLHYIGNPPDSDPPPDVDYDLWLGPAPKRPFNPNRFHWNYIYFWDYAGGMMTAWGAHDVDIVHWAMGQEAPRTVSASGGKYAITDARETPDTLDALFEYPGFTLQVSIYHANALPIWGLEHGLAFVGTKGTMLLTRQGFEVKPEQDQMAAVRGDGSPMDGPFQQEFLECVKSRRKPFADVETGHKSSIPPLLANISYRVGRKLQWDSGKERFIGDDDANQFLSRQYRKPWKM